MAILSNGRQGAGYLAVVLTVDKRLESSRPFSRGPVVSWTPDLAAAAAITAVFGEPEPLPPEWPELDKSKVGWLNCTIRFIVGETIIYQQGVLVQFGTIWVWGLELHDLVKREHDDVQEFWSGGESPELRLQVIREPVDLDLFGDNPPNNRYFSTLLACVDTGIAAGEPGVSGEGPAMLLYPTEAELLAFAHQLWQEAQQAG